MYDLSGVTTDVVVRAPRIILLGGAKIGKSTFAAGAKNPIFIPVKREEGVDALNCAKCPVSETFEDVIGWLGAIYNGNHEHETVVIDSSSTLEPLIWEAVVKRAESGNSIGTVNGGYHKGYIEALTEWRAMTDWLDVLRRDRNMTSIIIGHVKVKIFNDPEGNSYDQYIWDIDQSAASTMYKWADSILFCKKEVITTKEKLAFGKEKSRGVELRPDERCLCTKDRPAHPGGGRYPFGSLPYQLPLQWNAFQDSVSQVMQQGQ